MLHFCASRQARYFKHVGSFIGVKTPALAALQKEHVGSNLLAPWDIADELLRDVHHELKCCGVLTLHRNSKAAVGTVPLARDSFRRVGQLLEDGFICDWAICDTVGSRVLGEALKRHPSDISLTSTLQ